MTLATATAPLTLNPVELGPVSNGAYVIRYTGQIPFGATLLLGVPDAANAIDVTHQKHNHLIDQDNLSRFLALIGNAGWWGAKGRCRLFLKQGSSITPASNEEIFDCPVKPLVCKPKLGGPTLGVSQKELNSLKYASDDNEGSFGRYLHIPAIDGCVYFRSGYSGRKLETDNDKRGLVCTSYITAVWALPQTSMPSQWTGTDIASCTGAPFFCADVGVNDQPLDQVKAYLSQNMDATFLVGSSGHIVLFVRGHVHEFTVLNHWGYNNHPIQSWKPKAHKWTVGKPVAQF